MNITLRIISSLIIIVILIALLSTGFLVNEEKAKQYEGLNKRSLLVAKSLQEIVESQLEKNNYRKLKRLVNKYRNEKRLLGLSVHSPDGMIIAISSSLPLAIKPLTNIANETVGKKIDVGKNIRIDSKEVYLYSKPILKQEKIQWILTVCHNADYINEKLINIWKQIFLRMLIIVVLTSILTLFFD